ncbi:MAG: hypothetical protein QXE99_05605 [Acidilobaceae archaeon]
MIAVLCVRFIRVFVGFLEKYYYTREVMFIRFNFSSYSRDKKLDVSPYAVGLEGFP